MEKLGIGLIGFGGIGKLHALGYNSLHYFYDPLPADIELVGVCTSRKETAKTAKNKYGFKIATTDYHELLQREDIDIIDCCLPNNLHYKLIIDAAEMGKHIYCEKPLAENYDKAEKIHKAVLNNNIKFQMAFNNRFLPAIMRAKQMINNNFIGKIYSFKGRYLHSGYQNPAKPISWRLKKGKAGGGALVDLGAHIIDLLRYLVGDFRSICSTTHTFIKKRPQLSNNNHYEEVDVDDICQIQVKLPEGGLGMIEASRFATGSNDELSFEIRGENGAFQFNLMEPNWLYAYDATEKSEPIGGKRGFKKIETVQRYPEPAVLPYSKSSISWMRGHIASQYNFIKTVVEDKMPRPNVDDGLMVQKIIRYAYLSEQENRWIEF